MPALRAGPQPRLLLAAALLLLLRPGLAAAQEEPTERPGGAQAKPAPRQALSRALDELRVRAVEARERSRVRFVVATVALKRAQATGVETPAQAEAKQGWQTAWTTSLALCRTAEAAKHELHRLIEYERAIEEIDDTEVLEILDRERSQAERKLAETLAALRRAIWAFPRDAASEDDLVAKAAQAARRSDRAAAALLIQLQPAAQQPSPASRPTSRPR